MIFRFVHAADIHLDTPFSGLAASDPEIAAELREASLTAWNALVERTLQEDAAFLLLAGDLYDGPERGIRSQFRFLRGIERLTAAGIMVFAVHGNHDPLEGWSGITRWPDGMHFLAADRVETVEAIWQGERVARIHGRSYPRREVRENLAADFRRIGRDLLEIGLLHANVGGMPGHAPYAPCRLEDLVDSNLDYWALGHIHQHQILHRAAPVVVYPGNLQARHPGETGARGAVAVEAEGREIHSVRFEPLDRVRFEEVGVDIAGIPDTARLADALLQAGEEAWRAADGRDLVLRGRLTGRGSLHRQLAREGGTDELLRLLREEAHGRRPWLWWDTVRAETFHLPNREALSSRGDLVADLLRQADALAGDSGALAAFWEEARRKAGNPPPNAREYLEHLPLPELLREAEGLVLDLLAGEEES